MILPYIDEANRYEGLAVGTQGADDTAEILQYTAEPVKAFLCPSSPGEILNNKINSDPDDPVHARSSYKGVFGDLNSQFNYSSDDCPLFKGSCISGGNGLFSASSSVRFRDMTDGASNTAAVGEVSYGINGTYTTDGTALRDYRGAVWIGVTPDGVRSNVATIQTLRGLNASGNKVNSYRINGSNTRSFGSHHLGGAHFVFGDGHIKFVSETLDDGLQNAVATRNGDELLGEF